MSKANLIRDTKGQLETHVWPGGYSLAFFMHDGETICGKCANGENGSMASTETDDDQWRVIGADVLWEGPAETCCHCNAEMPTEYGETDND